MTDSDGGLQLSVVTAAVADRYVVEREAGRGGMATVYAARDRRHDRRVAIKVLHPELTATVSAERFEREIHICAGLMHPNILALYDSGEANGILFYVMPFVDGESLRHLLDRQRELPVEQAMGLAREMVDALGYAHERGFVHRDIKPENILLGGGHALVADFGIARVLDADTLGLTHSGTIVGSPAYMSPEQAAAGEQVDGRSDLYSVGCVLYEMLVGIPPYAGGSAMRVMVQHAVDPIPSARAMRGELTPQIDGLIARAMAKDPADRFQSALAFQMAIDTALASMRDPAAARPAVVSSLTPANAPATSAGTGSVAVLPFTDNSAARDQEYLCDGIADDLRTALSKIPALKVASRTSSATYKGKMVDARAVGKDLNVATVLDGNVQRSGNRLRVSTFLSSTADGTQLWSERYERDADDIFAVQDEIVGSVVESLRVTLGGGRTSAQQIIPRMTSSVEAYQLYLRGRHFWSRREEGGLQKAVECFRQALEVDPLYVMPYIGLADAFNTFGAYEYLPPHETFPKVHAAAQRALSIDPTLAEAHTALGSERAFYAWDWKAAGQSFAEAIALNPQYALAQAYYSLMLAATGRHDRARDAIAKAQQLDPLSQIINALVGWVAYYGRRNEDAIRQYRLTLAMEPNFPVAHSFLGFSFLATGRNEDALKEFQSIPGFRTGMGGLGCAYAKCGKTDEAHGVLAELDRLSQSTYVSSFSHAMVYIGLGNHEAALDKMEQALDEHGYTFGYVAVTPMVDPLRGHPRFKSILTRMGLADVPGAFEPH